MEDFIYDVNGPHRRWVHFGIESYLRSNENKIVFKFPHVLTSNIKYNNADKHASLILLDSAEILAANYSDIIDSINSKKFDNVFVVGNSCLKISEIRKVNNIHLLFNQGFFDIKTNRKHLNKVSIGKYILPGWFYFLKDVTKHPKTVKKLVLCKKLIYAGQVGTDSIVQILVKHKVFNNINESNVFVLAGFEKFEKDLNSFSIQELTTTITNTYAYFNNVLEDALISKTQNDLYFQRQTIIFKSVFRYFILKYLVKQDVLTYVSNNQYIRIYNSGAYKRNVFVDFGGINGYEKYYPRTVDMLKSNINFFQFDQAEMEQCQVSQDEILLQSYLEKEINRCLSINRAM